MNTYDVTILCVNNNMSIYQDIFETKSSQHILKNKYDNFLKICSLKIDIGLYVVYIICIENRGFWEGNFTEIP